MADPETDLDALLKRLDDSYQWCVETGKGGRPSTEALLDAAAAIRALRARADLARTETAWLIERRTAGAPTRWWTGLAHRPSLEWGSPDHAVRFARKQDAEVVIPDLWVGADEVLATEHAWVPPAPVAETPNRPEAEEASGG